MLLYDAVLRMQKRGKRGYADFGVDTPGFLFLLGAAFLILTALFILPQTKSPLTGLAVAEVDDQTLFGEVQRLLQQFPITKHLGSGSEFCLLVKTGETNFKSFDIFKSGSKVSVAPSPYSTYCSNDINNQGSEDFVFQYNTYDAFKQHLDQPDCGKFRELLKTEQIYYLASEFVQSGGKPVCNALFQERYCSAAMQCVPYHELPALGLDCCIGQQPQSTFPAFGSQAFVAMIFLFVVLVLLSVLVLVHIKHKHQEQEAGEAKEHQHQVEAFIDEGLEDGYSKDELKEALLEQGWDEQTIDPILQFK
ncbi:MAG: hypothetical protein QT07_C0008G0005 [archaeon GW2011_AR16]|nr:MAG: hypothetical protein QT07_C0008G0005 [archaeon GW2011_AR16]